jgi:predicted peroxiredoxin
VKFAYLTLVGASDPTRASIPFHMAANGTVEVGYEALILLAGDATELLQGQTRESLQGVGVPPMRELMAKLRDHEVPVYV